jgi:uncharacterized membrane protein (DUF2068 family)
MAARRDRYLTLIAVFKIVKALALIALAVSATSLLRPGTAAQVREWVLAFPLFAMHEPVRRAAGWLLRLDRDKIEVLSLAAIAYAGLFLTEGIGLWMQKRWAEYLTVVATASFLPFEIYELVKRVDAARLATLAVNLLVLGYLIWKLRRR